MASPWRFAPPSRRSSPLIRRNRQGSGSFYRERYLYGVNSDCTHYAGEVYEVGYWSIDGNNNLTTV